MTTTKKLTPGARVVSLGQDTAGRETQEPAQIVRAINSLAGYWLVKFDTGGELCVHKSRLRAV